MKNCSNCKHLGWNYQTSWDVLDGNSSPYCNYCGKFISTGGLFSRDRFSIGCEDFSPIKVEKELHGKAEKIRQKNKSYKPSMGGY